MSRERSRIFVKPSPAVAPVAFDGAGTMKNRKHGLADAADSKAFSFSNISFPVALRAALFATASAFPAGGASRLVHCVS